jgi:protein phosphatase
MRIFGRTDVGMVREHNEDNFLIADLTQQIRSMKPEVRTHVVGPRGTLFAVCDGMGGAAAGEVASQMAVDTIHDLVQNGPPPENRDQFAHRMTMAINEAGARIFLAAKSNRAQRGMGTTSTVAGVFGKTLFVGQVGDSRAYMVRNSKIKQLSKDQSLVSKLIEAGQLTEAEAESYEHSHIILQALGTSDAVSVDLSFMDIRKGDCVLLCSDGLSGLVTSEQMREVLTTTDEPMDACKKLTDLANAAGGHDNVTVIVARFDGDVPVPGPDDEIFGYQPYVISEQMEPAPAARASGKIKTADLPPPGKDIKNAVSIRPPPSNGAPPVALKPDTRISGPLTAAPDDDDISLPVSNTPRIVLAVLLIAVAVAVLGVAAMLFLRGRGSSGGSHPATTHASASGGSPRAETPPSGTGSAPVVTALTPPAGWGADAAQATTDAAAAATTGTAATDAHATPASAATPPTARDH